MKIGYKFQKYQMKDESGRKYSFRQVPIRNKNDELKGKMTIKVYESEEFMGQGFGLYKRNGQKVCRVMWRWF